MQDASFVLERCDVKGMSARSNKKDIISSLFFKLLPVQVAILAMGSINSIIDGAIAGRYIDSVTVGVIGLYYPMVQVCSGVASILLGGTSVLMGKHMGRGDMEKTRGVFSLNLALTIIIGGFLSVASFIFAAPLADLLGASPDLKDKLILYIRGFAIGILPFLLATQVGYFLEIERQSKRNYVGVGVMIVANILADIVLVAVFNMGILGLAIATSACNILYCLILLSYYFKPGAQLKFSRKAIDWKSTWPVIKIGFPGALLVLCLAIRGGVLNRLLLQYGGTDGLSAMASFNMIGGLFMAYCIGGGIVVRTLTSIFIGEEDKYSIKHLIKVVFSKGLAVTAVIAAIIIVFSGLFASIFFPDTTTNVFALTKSLIIVYGLCIPLILVCCVFTNYMQAMEHNLYVNFLSTFDGFFAMIIPAMILAPLMGIKGIWLAIPIGIILTMLATPVYCMIWWKRKPRNMDEWMFFKPDFGVAKEDAINVRLTSVEDVVNVSEQVEEFCVDHGLDHKTAYHAALCLEEMAVNVVTHGFEKDDKDHQIDLHVMYKDDKVLLRIKDDCVPFNPQERADQVSPDDPIKGIGIRMVMKIAEDVSYNNLLGLNVLTITLNAA